MTELPKDKSEASSAFLFSKILYNKKNISMTMGRLKHIHLVLMLGISLLLPMLLAYSLYADLSGDALFSSDMSFENLDDEDLLTCQGKFKVFVPAIPSSSLLPWTHFGRGSSLFSSPLTSDTQIMPVLRC